jgi:cytochrome c7-like protein
LWWQTYSMIKKILIFIVFTLGIIEVTNTFGDSAAPLLGDHSDGSRAIPVHLIPLLDEEGQEIALDDDPLLPFSARQTCAFKCHSYETITSGWHFNALNATPALSGRPGQPWIFSNADTGTQIPLSQRGWPGTYKPEQIGMTDWQFNQQFGGHSPGGGIGEVDESDDLNETMRMMVSGKLEANCLSCHDADPAHDQAEYQMQVVRQNFRWAAAATSGFTSMRGSASKMPDTYDFIMPDELNDPKLIPPTVTYRNDAFDHKDRVFFNIKREVDAERCYYCHTTANIQSAHAEKWTQDQDVHLAAGLTCVDCHRNGLNHNMVRGYEGEEWISDNPMSAASSCRGCHLGTDASNTPSAGRLAAPEPVHAGIPAVHFNKLTCTACHSGTWPDGETHRVKTSLAHRLGEHQVNKSEHALPHIISPVMARTNAGKIAPHHIIWPSFWGTLQDKAIKPLAIDVVKQAIPQTVTDAKPENSGDWKTFSDEIVRETLTAIANINTASGSPVFVSGGKVYQLDDTNKLIASKHDTAQPYMWQIGHNVRPAQQSLGVRGCQDCHSLDANFFFGNVEIDSPLASDATIPVIELQESSPLYTKIFAFTFIFRPWFKVIVLISAIIISAVLLLFAFTGLNRLMIYLADEQEWKPPLE